MFNNCVKTISSTCTGQGCAGAWHWQWRVCVTLCLEIEKGITSRVTVARLARRLIASLRLALTQKEEEEEEEGAPLFLSLSHTIGRRHKYKYIFCVVVVVDVAAQTSKFIFDSQLKVPKCPSLGLFHPKRQSERRHTATYSRTFPFECVAYCL